jgi:hypothetical protein
LYAPFGNAMLQTLTTQDIVSGPQNTSGVKGIIVLNQTPYSFDVVSADNPTQRIVRVPAWMLVTYPVKVPTMRMVLQSVRSDPTSNPNNIPAASFSLLFDTFEDSISPSFTVVAAGV